MSEHNPNRLLVEGDEDKRVIPQLVEANGIRWGERNEPPVVEIKALDGIEQLLRPGRISTELDDETLLRLGVLLDADDDPGNCWQRVRKECLAAFPDFPDSPRPDGAIVQDPRGRRLGVWLMPDNQSRGMLETFLAHLVPESRGALWAYAQEAVAEVRDRFPRDQHAYCYKDTHRDKAAIHTWLAWQDPPGCQLHHAVLQRVLDPGSPLARPFIAWFRRLYEL